MNCKKESSTRSMRQECSRYTIHQNQAFKGEKEFGCQRTNMAKMKQEEG